MHHTVVVNQKVTSFNGKCSPGLNDSFRNTIDLIEFNSVIQLIQFKHLSTHWRDIISKGSFKFQAVCHIKLLHDFGTVINMENL